LINEGLELSSQPVVLALAATVFFPYFFFFFLIAAGAKFVYGDWGTTWNVGCFLVALAFGNAHLDVGYSCRVLMASGVAPKDACIFHRSSDA
jgi:hypothetical protein